MGGTVQNSGDINPAEFETIIPLGVSTLLFNQKNVTFQCSDLKTVTHDSHGKNYLEIFIH